MKRLLILAVAGALAAVAAPPLRVVHACGQFSCVPVLASVTPLQIVSDGKPVQLALRGQNLIGITAVMVLPLVAPQAWSVPDDRTLLLTLPAGIAPGIYSVRVVAPGGASDPSFAPQFQVFPPPPPTATPLPAATHKPSPASTATPRATATPLPPLPETGVLGVVLPASAHQTSPPDGPAPAVAGGSQVPSTPAAPATVIGGLIIGALLVLLWGNPQRLDGTWRTQPLRHLVGRPVQALGVGHVCLYCGRLHFITSTPRELWRAGRFCQQRCLSNASGAPPDRVRRVRRGRG